MNFNDLKNMIFGASGKVGKTIKSTTEQVGKTIKKTPKNIKRLGKKIVRLDLIDKIIKVAPRKLIEMSEQMEESMDRELTEKVRRQGMQVKFFDRLFFKKEAPVEEETEEMSRSKKISLLVAQLENEQADERLKAVKALEEIGDVLAVEPLIKTLWDYHSSVREASARALGKLGDSRAVDRLIKSAGDHIESHESAWTHNQNILGALGDYSQFIRGVGGDDEKFTLRGSMENYCDSVRKQYGDYNDDARAAAVAALGDIGNVRAVEPLVKVLKNDEKSFVREAAARALGKIGHVITRPIFESMRSEDVEIRQQGADAYARLRPMLVEPLIEALEDQRYDPDHNDVRGAAATAIGEIGDDRSVFLLINCLKDNKASVRAAAAVSLGQLGDEMAIEPLVEVLADYKYDPEKHNLRGKAAASLEMLGWKPTDDANGARYYIAKRQYEECLNLGKVSIAPLIKVFSDADKELRMEAAQTVVKFGPPVVPLLIKTLEDHKSSVRASAAAALGEIKDPRAVDHLIFILADDQKPAVREAAALALGRIGDLKAVDQLIKSLQANPDYPEVRQSTAIALGDLKDDRAVEPLITSLSDKKSAVRMSSATALGQIGNKKAIDFLLHTISDFRPDPENNDVRGAAAESLSLLGWTPGNDNTAAYYHIARKDYNSCIPLGSSAVEPLYTAMGKDSEDVCRMCARAMACIGTPAVEMLIRAMWDEQAHVRREAALALGVIGESRAVEPLIRVLSDSDEYVKAACAFSLGALGDVRAIEALTDALNYDKTSIVREAAARALGHISPKVLKPIMKAMKDPRQEVALKAEAAWKKVGEVIVEPLLDALDDYSEDKDGNDVRGASAEALGNIGDPRALEILMYAVVNDKKPSVREAAAGALGKIGNPKAVEPLIKALADESKDYNIAGAAAASLDLLGWKPSEDADGARYYIAKKEYDKSVSSGDMAVEPLIGALGSDDEKTSTDAFKALVKFGSSITGRLIEALGSDSERVQAGAAGALIHMGDECMPELIEGLENPDEAVRAGICQVLGRIRSPRPVDALIKKLWDESEEVREFAAEALGDIGDTKPVDILIKSLNNIKPSVRQSSATALGKIGDLRAVEPLVKMLEDYNYDPLMYDVRKASAEALDRLGWKPPSVRHSALYFSALYDVSGCLAQGEVSVEPLGNIIRHGRPEYSRAATEALASLGIISVDPLVELLADPRDTVRREVIEALIRIGPEAVSRLIISLTSDNESIREGIVEVLGQIGTPEAIEAVQERETMKYGYM